MRNVGRERERNIERRGEREKEDYISIASNTDNKAILSFLHDACNNRYIITNTNCLLITSVNNFLKTICLS